MQTEAAQFMSDVPGDINSGNSEKEVDREAKTFAIVQCNGFRCLAYRDGNVWRNIDTGEELREVQNIMDTFDRPKREANEPQPPTGLSPSPRGVDDAT